MLRGPLVPSDPAPPMIALETERLVLRHLDAEHDAAFIQELLNTPAFLRYIGDRGVRTEADAKRYIEEGPVASYAEHGFGLFAVDLRASGEAVGICGLLRRPALADPDLGFAFLPAAWGHGYATEAAAATRAWGHEIHSLDRIVAITQSENAGSIGVLEKSGFRFERMVTVGDDDQPLRLYVAVAETKRPAGS